ncbi:hypothetical protein DITRI_Ditri02bG0092300 [Diplodiscus trichospermus]
MGRGVIFFCFLLFALGAGVHGFPMNDLISKLPGQPDVSFRQFAGYIDLDEKAGSSLFYYFVEAESDPMTKPLTIWLTGGPGCSSVGDGFASVGPFVTTNNARGLQRNLFSWNKVSNLLFIDSPIGAGWSYSNTSSDYSNGDDSTNKNLMTFILKWYEKYPDFKSRDVYLAGSSFAGHFVPNFANSLLDYNKQSNGLKINVKGLALGNPMLRKKLDIRSRFDFFFSRGMISSELHQEIEKECNAIDENNYYANTGTNWTAACTELMSKAPLVAFKTDDPGIAESKLFDVLRDQCSGTLEELKSGKEVSMVSYEVEMCLPLRADFYFNLPEVQTAFHGNRTKLSYAWKGCFADNFKYNETDKDRDMLPALKNILQQSIPIIIFSGDQDGIIPTMGTIKHLKKLAEELNLQVTKDEAWKHENKDGGWKYSYGDLLSFWTVKGANHHVTFSRPSEALSLFTNFTTAGLH